MSYLLFMYAMTTFSGLFGLLVSYFFIYLQTVVCQYSSWLTMKMYFLSNVTLSKPIYLLKSTELLQNLAHINAGDIYQNRHAQESHWKTDGCFFYFYFLKRSEQIVFSRPAVLSETLTPPLSGHLTVTKQAAETQTGSEPYFCNALPSHDQSSSAGRRGLTLPVCAACSAWCDELNPDLTKDKLQIHIKSCNQK